MKSSKWHVVCDNPEKMSVQKENTYAEAVFVADFRNTRDNTDKWFVLSQAEYEIWVKNDPS